jgi:hypothetical protein
MASTRSLSNVHQGVTTVESSNLLYSELTAAPQQKIVQHFGLPGSQAAQAGGAAARGGPVASTDCPHGQTYNSLAKQCEVGNGRIIDNDQAPPQRTP